jgi:hemolysin-activating ACP:hemolysin acyltransferase
MMRILFPSIYFFLRELWQAPLGNSRGYQQKLTIKYLFNGFPNGFSTWARFAEKQFLAYELCPNIAEQYQGFNLFIVQILAPSAVE